MTAAPKRSLYDHLGVPPTADDATIRRAYRKRAKSTHPDTPGGSTRAFAETSRALAILLDPVRRAKYDATGDASDAPSPPSRMAELMELVMPLLDQVCAAAAQRGLDPLTQPLDRLMLSKATATLTEIRKKRAHGEAELRQAKKFLGRFKRQSQGPDSEAAEAPDAPNLIEQGILHRISMIENSLRMVDAEIERWERALGFLAEYRFDAVMTMPTGATAATAPPGFIQMFTTGR